MEQKLSWPKKPLLLTALGCRHLDIYKDLLPVKKKLMQKYHSFLKHTS